MKHTGRLENLRVGGSRAAFMRYCARIVTIFSSEMKFRQSDVTRYEWRLL